MSNDYAKTTIGADAPLAEKKSDDVLHVLQATHKRPTDQR